MSGQTEDSEEVDVIERRFVLKKHRRRKYRCERVDCQGVIETAPIPARLIAGGRYSIDFAIEVAAAKYLDHMPLERQVRQMKREGLDVDSQTLWDQIEALSRYLGPVVPRIVALIKAEGVLGADETTWRVMGDEKKTWQVFSVAARRGVAYQIEDSRGVDAATKLLGGFKGVAVVDGLATYEVVARREGFTLANCWAHVRRKFVECEDFHPEQARFAIEKIGALYDVERTAISEGVGADEVLRRRRELSVPIIRELKDWAMAQRGLPESSIMKAIAYMSTRWTGLTRFLEDGRVPIDNNATERALRGVVIGRKNHYGSRSRRGTEVAALLYTLMETAKLCGVEPKAYLRRAVKGALAGNDVPLPHELAVATVADSEVAAPRAQPA